MQEGKQNPSATSMAAGSGTRNVDNRLAIKGLSLQGLSSNFGLC